MVLVVILLMDMHLPASDYQVIISDAILFEYSRNGSEVTRKLAFGLKRVTSRVIIAS